MHESIGLVGFQPEDSLPKWLLGEEIKYSIAPHIIKTDLLIINTKNYKANKKDYLENKNIIFFSKSENLKHSWYNKLKPTKIFSDLSDVKNNIIENNKNNKKTYRAEAEWVDRAFSASSMLELLLALEEIKKWLPNLQSVGVSGEDSSASLAHIFMLEKNSFSVSCLKIENFFSELAQTQRNSISTKLGRAVGSIKMISGEGFHLILEGTMTRNERLEAQYLFLKYEKILAHKINILVNQYLYKKESLLWQTVFETVSDPAVLLSSDKVLSSNKAFDVFNKSSEKEKNKYNPKKYFIDKKKNIFFVRYESVEASKKLHQKALQQEKMAALGSVAGQIAHALNNPLTGILSMSQVLQRKYNAESSVSDDLKEIEKAALRCNKIVQNLRSYSNESSKDELVPVEASMVLKDTMSFVKVEVGKYKYKVSYVDERCVVNVNPQLLQQVFFNLIINATHAVSGSDGVIDIGIRQDKEFVIFYVKDNGAGMTEEIQGKIFEPFFTTKIKDKGTGLGLSLVRDIVKSFSGKIVVKSNVGVGSLFEVYLPIFSIDKAGC